MENKLDHRGAPVRKSLWADNVDVWITLWITYIAQGHKLMNLFPQIFFLSSNFSGFGCERIRKQFLSRANLILTFIIFFSINWRLQEIILCIFRHSVLCCIEQQSPGWHSVLCCIEQQSPGRHSVLCCIEQQSPGDTVFYAA